MENGTYIKVRGRVLQKTSVSQVVVMREERVTKRSTEIELKAQINVAQKRHHSFICMCTWTDMDRSIGVMVCHKSHSTEPFTQYLASLSG